MPTRQDHLRNYLMAVAADVALCQTTPADVIREDFAAVAADTGLRMAEFGAKKAVLAVVDVILGRRKKKAPPKGSRADVAKQLMALGQGKRP